METFFVKVFWLTNILLWIALLILYFILTNKSSLEKKGYTKKYIEFIRKSQRMRIISIAIIMPLLELISALIVYLLTGPLLTENQLAYIIILLFVLIVPFKLLDEKISKNKLKDLALETKEKIAIDLNFQTLHLIFNPKLELLITASAFFFGIIFLKIEVWIVYIFLILPWLMYFTMRGMKYQTKPYLVDNYKYMFAFNTFSFLFFFVYYHSSLLSKISESLFMANTTVMDINQGEFLPLLILLLAGFLISILLLGRVAVYISNYKKFKSDIKGLSEKVRNSFARRLIFVSAAMIILLVFTGLGLFTDIITKRNNEVGKVLKKYAIDFSGAQADTIILVPNSISYNPIASNEMVQNDYVQGNKFVKLFCEIEVCNANKVKRFEICCYQTFNKLLPETIIKFTYDSNRIITRLIE